MKNYLLLLLSVCFFLSCFDSYYVRQKTDLLEEKTKFIEYKCEYRIMNEVKALELQCNNTINDVINKCRDQIRAIQSKCINVRI